MYFRYNLLYFSVCLVVLDHHWLNMWLQIKTTLGVKHDPGWLEKRHLRHPVNAADRGVSRRGGYKRWAVSLRGQSPFLPPAEHSRHEDAACGRPRIAAADSPAQLTGELRFCQSVVFVLRSCITLRSFKCRVEGQERLRDKLFVKR